MPSHGAFCIAFEAYIWQESQMHPQPRHEQVSLPSSHLSSISLQLMPWADYIQP